MPKGGANGTIKEVAGAAVAPIGTVPRVLTDNARVPSDLRQMVQRVIGPQYIALSYFCLRSLNFAHWSSAEDQSFLPIASRMPSRTEARSST